MARTDTFPSSGAGAPTRGAENGPRREVNSRGRPRGLRRGRPRSAYQRFRPERAVVRRISNKLLGQNGRAAGLERSTRVPECLWNRCPLYVHLVTPDFVSRNRLIKRSRRPQTMEMTATVSIIPVPLGVTFSQPLSPAPSNHLDRSARYSSLIMKMAAGSEDALAELYDLTNRLVFSLALRILRDRGAAEEVTMDVFLQAWKQASNFNSSRGTPLAWLTTMARSVRSTGCVRSGAIASRRRAGRWRTNAGTWEVP
jgi:hypothetical protein